MKKFKIAMPVILAVMFSCIFITGCLSDDNNSGTDAAYAQGKVIILQAYGSSSDAAGASHSFVELYNITDEEIDLNGISLYYADGTSVANNATPNTATEDDEWKSISLDGYSIPAKGSFLILGPKQSASARYQIPENSGDINDDTFTLSNRAFKVALIQSTEELTVPNPFTADKGKPIAGYIDMVGAANDYQGRDLIFGFETEPARNSASEAVRRIDLTDTDNNQGGYLFPLGSEASVDYDGDFVSVRYAITNSSTNKSITNEELEVLKPRNSSEGEWDPFAEPEPPVIGEGSPKLMILQVGASADDSNNVSHTFVELYNNTSQAITLTGTYSLQYAEGTKVASDATEDLAWAKIDLAGTIQPYHSFLILGAKRSTNNTPGLKIDDNSGDMNETGFKLSNRAGKVVLMNNQTLLSVQNPFNSNGGQPATGYVDMVGYFNDNTDRILGFETQPIGDITKQAGARRTTLNDTDNNLADFEKVAYNNASDEVIALKRPRNHAHGEWNPITGE